MAYLPIADCRLPIDPQEPKLKIGKSKAETRRSKFDLPPPVFEFRVSIFVTGANRQSAIENRQSLVPQRHHGIDLGCPARGDVAGQPGDCQLHEHNERESCSVGGPNGIEVRNEKPCQGEGGDNPGGDPDQKANDALAED
jgi:hypothetical protein